MARDTKFKPGNKVGKQFSSEYQPEKRRQKGKSVSQYLKELGDATDIEFNVTVTKANGEKRKLKGKIESEDSINQLIATTLINKAVQGDLKAIKEFQDRTEGRPQQSLKLDAKMQPVFHFNKLGKDPNNPEDWPDGGEEE